MTLTMQLPMFRSQALCRDAESVRQEQVKKTVFNNALWTKLMCMVKEHPELQTATIPSKPTKGQATKNKQWEPDLLFEVIEIAKPLNNYSQNAAESFVEREMVPKFRRGMSTDIIQAWENGDQSEELEDT